MLQVIICHSLDKLWLIHYFLCFLKAEIQRDDWLIKLLLDFLQRKVIEGQITPPRPVQSFEEQEIMTWIHAPT